MEQTMTSRPDIKATTSFRLLPAFAGWLSREHLDELIGVLVDSLRKKGVETPMGNDNFSVAEMKQAAHAQMEYFLNCLTANNLQPILKITHERWIQLFTDKETGDLALPDNFNEIHNARKEAFMHFLPLYTQDFSMAMALVKELDEFINLFVYDGITLKTSFDNRKLNNALHLLKHRERQLLEAQEIALVGSFEWNLESHGLNMTPQAYRIFEFEGQIKFEVFMDRIHNDDRQLVTDAITNSLTSGEYAALYRYNAPSGLKWINSMGKVNFVSGKADTLSGTIQDVTDQHLILEDLKASEDRFNRAEAIAKVGSWNYNFETGIQTWSREMYRIYELDPSEPIPPTGGMDKYHHPDDLYLINEARKAILDGAEYFENIYRVCFPDGRIKFILSKRHTIRDVSGKLTEAQGTIQDVSDQQELLHQLKISEERYKEAEMLAHIGHFRFEIATGKHFWTDEMYRIYGWEPGSAENTFENVRKAVLPADLDRILETNRNTVEKGVPYDVTFQIIRKDGVVRHINSIGTVEKDPDGKVTHLFGTTQDITEREELIARLQESQELFNQAQSLGKIGNFIYDVASGETKWSDEMYRIYGSVPGDKTVTANKLRSYTLPRYRKIIDSHIKRCIENGIEYQFQYEIQLPGGAIKTLRGKGAAERDSDGKINRILGTAQDVTEYVMIEQRLRENRRFNEKIANATPAIITVFNVNTGQYKFVSNMIELLLGYTVDEITEKGYAFMASLCHPEDAERVMAENLAAISAANDLTSGYEDDKIIEFRYRMRHKEGHYVWLQTYAIIFDRNSDGLIDHVLNVSIDVSNIVDAEEQLQRNNLLLRQSNSSLEEFAYIASHDLQEPLRKVATFGNMLQTFDNGQLDVKAKLYLDKIVDSASRMQSMINDLLAVSLINRDNQFASTNLQYLLHEVLQTLEYKIESTGTTVVIAQPLPAARVIDSQFHQLFQNLLSNSIKFARQDVPCHITISWESLPASAGPGYGLQEHISGFLKIDFQDNGIGFDNQYAQRIFAIFQRLHGKSEFEGSGIGLAICRKITEHHHGKIFATGERGQGATFTVIIPQ